MKRVNSNQKGGSSMTRRYSPGRNTGVPPIKPTLVVLLLLVLPAMIHSQVEHSKTVQKSFRGIDRVELEHRYGPLTVQRSADGQVHFEATISVTARSEEEARAALEHFDISAYETGSLVEINSSLNIKNWKSRNGRIQIDFNDGSRVKDLRKLRIEFVLSVPRLEELKLANRYDDILIQDDLAANLTIDSYSGKIETRNIEGHLNLSMKYGKGRIGNAGDSQLNLYDCNLTTGNLRDVTLTSKYSKLQLGDVNRLSADTYDDELTFGRITGPLTMTDKYSDVNIKSFGSARIDFYDSNLTAGEGRDMQIKSKYTKFSIGRLESLAFELSYDDAVTIDQLGSLTAESKYTNFKIGTLGGSLMLKSYDDQVQVGAISGPLDTVDFNGKYTDLSLPIPAGQPYRLEANLTYGRLVIPEGRFDNQFYKEKNDRLEVRGRTRGATEESPLVSILSYDGKITLQ